jgi:hypothetical protein
VEAKKHNTSLAQSLSKAATVVWFAVALSHIEGAQAQTPVAIELALAVDTSMSIDTFEYDLLMKGIASAFRAPEVVTLIGQHDGVAVMLFQWNSEIDERYAIPWQLLTDPASISAFAAKVEKAERNPNRVFTGIGTAIDYGMRSIAENAFEGPRLNIDVSGDGRNNIGVAPSVSRREAGAMGIVINGLPILTHIAGYSNGVPTSTEDDFYDLDTYYRENVIFGPGAFVETANDYDDFARAFLRKLLREIAPQISQKDAVPRTLIQETHARRRNAYDGR